MAVYLDQIERFFTGFCLNYSKETYRGATLVDQVNQPGNVFDNRPGQIMQNMTVAVELYDINNSDSQTIGHINDKLIGSANRRLKETQDESVFLLMSAAVVITALTLPLFLYYSTFYGLTIALTLALPFGKEIRNLSNEARQLNKAIAVLQNPNTLKLNTNAPRNQLHVAHLLQMEIFSGIRSDHVMKGLMKNLVVINESEYHSETSPLLGVVWEAHKALSSED